MMVTIVCDGIDATELDTYEVIDNIDFNCYTASAA